MGAISRVRVQGDSIQSSVVATPEGCLNPRRIIIPSQTLTNSELIEEIRRFWFLLDRELYQAILKLLHTATAKINFFKGVINLQLLEDGINGEEEALCNINSFLHNNGWWMKASNLNVRDLGVDIGKTDYALRKDEEDIREFIRAHKAMVHLNTFINIEKGDNEDTRNDIKPNPLCISWSESSQQ